MPPDRKPNPPAGSPRRSGPPRWIDALAVGSEFATTLVVLVLVGWWLDRAFQTTPLLLVVGVVLGFVSGLWRMIRQAKRFL